MQDIDTMPNAAEIIRELATIAERERNEIEQLKKRIEELEKLLADKA